MFESLTESSMDINAMLAQINYQAGSTAAKEIACGIAKSLKQDGEIVFMHDQGSMLVVNYANEGTHEYRIYKGSFPLVCYYYNGEKIKEYNPHTRKWTYA